jgi:hypothetical protein
VDFKLAWVLSTIRLGIVNNNGEKDHHPQLRMFMIYMRTCIQHVSAEIGHCQVMQNTKKKNMKQNYCALILGIYLYSV